MATCPSVAERLATGKALRRQVSRRAHGELNIASDRQDPIAILEAQAQTRLPELVPVRYARMLTSPFAFLRGSAAVMIGDIAHAPTIGVQVQACGDMHVANFGVFASAERNLVFGINDFDETHIGAWEWDLKRLTASAVVAGRFLGGDRALCEEAAQTVVQSYRNRMREYAHFGYLELWYANIREDDLLKVLPPESRKRAVTIAAKARHRTHLQVLDKMTDLIDNQQRIVETHPLIVRAQTTSSGRPISEALELLLQDYLASMGADRRFLLSRYRILDVARKVVGVGSVGTRCWVIYMQGRDTEDPLFLQVKEAQPSVLASYAGNSPTPVPANQGQRVVDGQRLIQGAPDIFLGWGEQDGFQYYVRQLRDMKGGVEFDPTKFKVTNLPAYCDICGWALALAHAKSGDAAILAGYMGKSEEFDEAIAKFAHTYADQTERDYDRLAAAARQGRIQVANKF
ncbi:DUF2252 domain-containing protein [Tumidithrix helvetica PCC 7403]|uniref:DUF2252 domain-containing protein n=1 Tax=Tumidithrix helvetica TaxID=3457545 RepID=UPI003CC33017